MTTDKVTLLIWFLSCFIFIESNAELNFFDELKHPCYRDCDASPEPRTCSYNFLLEWYIPMSKACYNCPFNKTDCFRPHCVTADGVKRALMGVNRQLPGPALHVCHGDTVQVTVKNHMEAGEGTSIHWHGIHQKNTAHMDGVGMVTQCPIASMSTFQYKFIASPPGTHFWHAHSGLQRADGIFGPLVVRQKQDVHKSLYNYDLAEHTLIVSDWMHELIVNKFANHHHSNGNNKPKGIVINGKGTFEAYTESTTGKVYYTPRYMLRVQQGSKYRIRVISAAILNCPLEISVKDHNLTMIASDGSPFEALEVESFVIYAGERYDFVLNANRPVGNYLINMVGLADCSNSHFSARQSAILSYKGSNETQYDNQQNPGWTEMRRTGKQLNPFNQKATEDLIQVTSLKSINSDYNTINVSKADVKHYIAFDFEKINNTKFHGPEYYPISSVMNGYALYTPQINNIAMTLPSSPLLYQFEETDSSKLCSNPNFNPDWVTTFKECHHVIRVELNQVVEFVLIDKGFTFDASHPFHLHGNYFRVVAMDKVGRNVSVDEVKALDNAGKIVRNTETSPFKDNVIVPDGGYTVIRFKADNPGAWFFHCHIEFHVEIGMGLLVLVGQPDTWKRTVPSNFPRCKNWLGEAAEPPRYDGYFIATIVLGVTSGVLLLVIIVMAILTCTSRRSNYAINENVAGNQYKS